MTPEEKQQFEDMQRRLENLERVENVDFVGNLEDRQILNVPEFGATISSGTSNGLLRNVSIGDGGGSFSMLEVPDRFLLHEYKGRVYKLWANNL